MAKADSDLEKSSKAADFDRKSTEEIRRSMAETRQIINQRIASMEGLMGQQIRVAVTEASERVIHTTDHVSNKIRETADHVKDVIKAPFQELQHQADMIPTKVQRKPLQTLAIAASTGLLFGAWISRRAGRRAMVIRRELMAALPPMQQVQQQIESAKRRSSPWSEALVAIGLPIAQQFIHMGISHLAERRSSPRRPTSPREAEVQIKRHGSSASSM